MDKPDTKQLDTAANERTNSISGKLEVKSHSSKQDLAWFYPGPQLGG